MNTHEPLIMPCGTLLVLVGRPSRQSYGFMNGHGCNGCTCKEINSYTSRKELETSIETMEKKRADMEQEEQDVAKEKANVLKESKAFHWGLRGGAHHFHFQSHVFCS